MKRFNALLLVVLLVLTLCLPVFATETDTLEFAVTDGEATLVSGEGATGEVIIPDSYQGYPVTAIDLGAFSYNEEITSVTIPESVRQIGYRAFGDCINLRQVTLSEGLEELDSCAFESCTSLTSIVLPNSVTKMGSGIFYSCSALESVQIGSGLHYLLDDFFRNCTALKEVVFGSNSQIETLWSGTFYGCTALESITLPETLVTIRDSCFRECTALQEITIPNSVKYIESNAFTDCTALTKVTLPERLKTIEEECFLGCENLSTINIPESLYQFGCDAFAGTRLDPAKILPDTLVQDCNGNYYGGIQVPVYGGENYDEATQVLKLVNQERAAAGKSSLVLDENLTKEAMQRAAEISVLFSHTRPVGESVIFSFDDVSGENIAFHYSDAEEVMNSWMNSEEHRANILDSNYTSIGIGCFDVGYMLCWVQVFSTKKDTTSIAPSGTKDVCTNVTICTDKVLIDGSDTSTNDFYALTDYYYHYYHLSTSEDSLSMEVGETYQLREYLENLEDEIVWAPSEAFSWSPSDPSVATVKDGLVTAVGKGTAIITVSVGELTGRCTVKVASDCNGGANCPSNRYTDVSASSWYHQSVDFVTIRGMMNGMSENKFGPSIPLTRGMMVTVLYRYEGSPVVETGIPFTDVASDTWYYDAVRWAAANGIVNGMTETTFEPQTDINREQMVTILQRYAIYNGIYAYNMADLSPYPDANQISPYAESAFNWAVSRGIINGDGTGLNPQGKATRAEVAKVLTKYVVNIME